MKTANLTISAMLFSIFMAGYMAPAAHAEDNKFTLHPTYTHQGNKNWIITQAQPEQTINEFLTLENLSAETQRITLLVKEATNNDGDFKPREDETYKDIGAWVHLPQTTYTLGAREKIKIPFTLSVPKDVPLQQYTGVIYAAREQINDQNIKVVTRLGVRIYLDVKALNPLSTNIFNTPAYKNTFFFGLSLAGFLGALFYNAITYLEKRKYEKQHA